MLYPRRRVEVIDKAPIVFWLDVKPGAGAFKGRARCRLQPWNVHGEFN